MLCTTLGSFILGTVYWTSVVYAVATQIRQTFIEDITVPLDSERLDIINDGLANVYFLGAWEFFLQARKVPFSLVI